MTAPWKNMRRLIKYPSTDPRPLQEEGKKLLTDADLLRGLALLVDDMLEPNQIWSVNPSKLRKVREAVEVLPKRLLNG